MAHFARIVKPHTVAGITIASIDHFIAARRLERGVKKVRSPRQQRSITICLTSRPLALLRYRVIRVWQLPVEQLLAGGVGTLPLAPISLAGAAPPGRPAPAQRAAAEQHQSDEALARAFKRTSGVEHSGERLMRELLRLRKHGQLPRLRV